jgi:hypothetical protein
MKKDIKMKLGEFITEAISEIIEGINNSNTSNRKVGLYSPGKNDQRHIEFDIAVTLTKSSSGSINLLVPFVTVGGKASDEKIMATTNRVKFGIRIK